jgi:hypothetical protein
MTNLNDKNDPLTDNQFSVENSCDDLTRSNIDVHNDNPGEEMNYHGALQDTYNTYIGKNYGYPNCFAAWDPSVLVPNNNIKVGTQFHICTPGDSGNTTDEFCQTERVAPRITFKAHIAPLDIKFNDKGTAAYISFHGSW